MMHAVALVVAAVSIAALVFVGALLVLAVRDNRADRAKTAQNIAAHQARFDQAFSRVLREAHTAMTEANR